MPIDPEREFTHLAFVFFDNNDPEVVLFDAADNIHGHLYFPTDRFSGPCMESLARNFMAFVMKMLNDYIPPLPEARGRCSDTRLRASYGKASAKNWLAIGLA